MNIKHGIIKLHRFKDNKPILININEIVAVVQSISKEESIIHTLDYNKKIKMITVNESVIYIHILFKDRIPSILVHTKKSNSLLFVPVIQLAYVEPSFEGENIDNDESEYYNKVVSESMKKNKEFSIIHFKADISPVKVNETIQKIYNKIQ